MGFYNRRLLDQCNQIFALLLKYFCHDIFNFITGIDRVKKKHIGTRKWNIITKTRLNARRKDKKAIMWKQYKKKVPPFSQCRLQPLFLKDVILLRRIIADENWTSRVIFSYLHFLMSFIYFIYLFLHFFLCGRLLSAVLSLFKISELKSQYFLHYFLKFTLLFFFHFLGKF